MNYFAHTLRRITLSLLLCGTVALLLAACGSNEPESQPTPTEVPTLEPADTPEPPPTDTPEPPPTDTPEPVPTDVPEAASTDEETATEETTAEEANADEEATEETATEETDVEEADAADDEQATTEEVAASADAETVDPRVFFLQPTNNAVVPISTTVVMGFEGLLVEPSGDVIEGSGHFHILVDTDFIEPGDAIPTDDQHLHFGDASTATTLELTPGSHTLRLQFANGAHIALEGEQYRDEIVVSVKDLAPEQAVRFAQPRDGATVPPTLDVVMAATGFNVEPAGEIRDNSGHFHILIDSDFVEPGEVILADDQHIHFGKAQLATTLELTPGAHTLRLQFANGAHIALEGDQYRDEITVMVEADAPAQQVQFASPADGDTVEQTFDVQMSAAGLFVESSGAVLRTAGGHMHILVDSDFIEPGEVIPADDQHIHFGGGQLVTELTLAPGEHILRLQMANGAHLALDGEQYRAEITVVVE